MDHYKRSISIHVLIFVLFSGSLIMAGCGKGKEFVETRTSSLSSSSVNCFNCHGNSRSGDALEKLNADIVDTHYDDWRIEGTCSVTTTNTCRFDSDCPDGESCTGIAFETSPTGKIEGYILDSALSWAPAGTGYLVDPDIKVSPALADAVNCAASCHDWHNSDMTKNRQWYKSGHANVNVEPFNHNFSSGICMRCHSGIGFAKYVDPALNPDYPDWKSPSLPSTEAYPHHITCNACHDAKGFPTAANKRLRKTGTVTFISGSSSSIVYDATVDAGNSAACISCHQGRESGWSVYKALKAKGVADPYDYSVNISGLGITFINPHYLPAGAVLFGIKGFEFKGQEYTPGNPMHQTKLCTGCHMADSTDTDLGGHTFKMKSSGKENIQVCMECHGSSVQSFETVGGYYDFDGDGNPGHVKDEIGGLKTLVKNELAAEGVYYDPGAYPYYWNSPTCRTSGTGGTPDCRFKNWTIGQLGAAFNLHFVDHEPGSFVHNYKYAAQLLWDSYAVLKSASFPAPSDPNDPATYPKRPDGRPLGARPTGSNDRPYTDYTQPNP